MTEVSVTEQLAELDRGGRRRRTCPPIGASGCGDLVLDSLGEPVRGHVGLDRPAPRRVGAQPGRHPECTLSSAATSRRRAALATLVNGAASHALENDDIATFSSHSQQPAHRGRARARARSSVRPDSDVVLAWMVGWEVTAQTMKVRAWRAAGNELHQPWLVQPGLPGDARRRRARIRLLGLDVEPDPDGARPRRVGDGRDDEEPRDRHEGRSPPEARRCTA